MDRFLEEAVSKRNRALDEVLYYASLVLMIVTGVLGFLFLQSVMAAGLGALIPAVVMIGIAVYLWFTHDKFRTEYEYTFTNGALDFAMVFNNKKRKSLGSLNVAKVALVNITAFEASGNVADLFLPKAIILAVVIFVGQKKLKWSPIIFLAIAAVVGIVFKF